MIEAEVISTLESPPVWVRLTAPIISRLPAGRYRAIKLICQRTGPPFLMQMPAELGGYSFQCDLRDGISRDVCFTGQYEPQETAVVRSILQPGFTFVDVGANWGYFTLIAANMVGRHGRVLSLEPDPRLFPVLRENVIRSELDHATVLQVAAAKEPGALTLAGYDERGDNFGISRIVTSSNESHQPFQVNADSLDRMFKEHDLACVDLMKMDIEGAEGLAIAGLAESLARHTVKRLLLEVHPKEIEANGSSADAIMNILEAAGYRGWTIDHSPSATRRAAYRKVMRVEELLRPLTSLRKLDAWPHQLWVARGIE